jgi:inner membrane protein involved in colicin E2 resistance
MLRNLPQLAWPELGSLGLFLILALVMYVTRRIDWYAPRIGVRTVNPAP